MNFRLSLICLAIFGPILSESAIAEPSENLTTSSAVVYTSPLLADTRNDDWKPYNEQSRDKSKGQHRERHQETPRETSKGPARERHQEPSRVTTKEPTRERYQPPPQVTTKEPTRERERYQTPPRVKPVRERERYQEPYRVKPKERERYRDDDRRHDRDGPVRWREHDGDRRYFEPRHYPPAARGRFFDGPPRHHRSRDVVIVQPFRYAYPRHHRYYRSHDSDLWGWLSFTAITLAIIDNLNDQQQRAHELALYDATAAPLGETIYWRDGNASGSVTPIQDGTSSEGRYCREFQHEVVIGGNSESLYGTACQNPDGSWEIVE